jgi:hypothetical protein
MKLFVKSDLALELEKAMDESMKGLNKTASSNKIDDILNNLNKSAELFDELGHEKSAEIITSIIEKIALDK